MEYDPLLAKLAVWAETRDEAIGRMSRALDEYHVSGIRTNLDFFRRLMRDEAFLEGRLHTGFIEQFLAREDHALEANGGLRAIAALVATLHARSREPEASPATVSSQWRSEGRAQLFR
jgi:acetyl-CoA carboxylase biotin carboxylase subunit